MFIGDLYQSSHGLWWWLPLTQLPTGDVIVVCVGFVQNSSTSQCAMEYLQISHLILFYETTLIAWLCA